MSKLIKVWIAVDTLLFASGVFIIVLSRLWAVEDLMLNLVFPPIYLIAGLSLGILYILTSLFSIPAALQTPARTTLLVWLNAALLIDLVCTMALASIVWFFSLRPIVNFEHIFRSLGEEARGKLERKLECCGYYNSTSSGGFIPSPPPYYCSDISQLASSEGCLQPILTYSEHALDSAFTCLYGLVAIIACFLIATTCLISERRLIVRYAKIDAKRGGIGGM